MREGPYLGITGFTTAAQAREALALVPPTLRRLVMVGVLASRRTCAGLPERSPRRLPAMEPIPGIFPDHLSFDAETCLRDEEDRLDPARVREYVEAALRL